MLLLNTLDLFCILVSKCIWQDLDVAIHVYIHIRGSKAKKSSQRPGCFGHITNSCRQIETDVENATGCISKCVGQAKP